MISNEQRNLNGQVQLNEQVKLNGWVHRVRVMKRIVFVVLRNTQGLFQCVLSAELYREVPLTPECVVTLEGIWQEANCDLGPHELSVSAVKVHNWPLVEPPIQVNGPELEANLDTILNNRVLALRHLKEQSIFKVHSALAQGFSRSLVSMGFTQIFTPKLVKEGAEGGANVFSLDYFGEKAYLAQSPQFYKQMMVIAGFERVFEIAPVFRAESHSTRRHLNEYTSLDVELGFIDSEEDLMQLETQLLREMLEYVATTARAALATLQVTLPMVPDQIPQIGFDSAIALLEREYGRSDLDGDLDPEAERVLSEHLFRETGSEFLFVVNYPQRKRPMYAMPLGEQGTRSFDLLFRGLEITTGGQRIHDRLELEANMIKKGLVPELYRTYLQAFDHGVPPHGGFAIGLERLTGQLLGYSNIRRTNAFPRDGQRLVP